MTSKFKPHSYQQYAIDFLVNRFFIQQEQGAALWLDPGLGKTAITLSVLEQLKFFQEVRTLVVAPLRVVYSVWPHEIKKWRFDLSYQIVHGSPNQRIKAMRQKAEIYLTNYESLAWLEKQQSGLSFDMLVMDESTKLKNWSAKRTKALKKMLPAFRYRLSLTGTPSPNSLEDLFSQVYMLDDGETFGKTITYFRNRFCYRGGFQGRQWVFNYEKTTTVHELVADLVLRLDEKDHLDLPAIVYNNVWVDLPPMAHRTYRQMERQLFTAIGSGENLAASSAGAKYAMCRGIANGGAYEGVEDRITHKLHDAKTDAVCDIVEELSGKPVLIAYQFNHDLERLQERFPKAPVIKGGTPPRKGEKIVKDWNTGKIHVLLVQPQSLSHGVNLQSAGNDVIWYGLTDQLEVYLQLNKRIHRQGVTGQVRIHHVLARRTVDEAIRVRIEQKRMGQQGLLNALNEYRERRILEIVSRSS